MPRNRADKDSDSCKQHYRPTRRTYLKAAGAATLSIPLFAGEGAATTERYGISFDNEVDMVDDAGCDPTGNEACDSNLQSAAASNTLLKFPSGTYSFTSMNALDNYSNFGIYGEDDVTFVVPEEFNDKLLTINHGTGVLLENISIDQSNATPGIQVAPDDNLQVHGLEVTGQGIDSAIGNGAENGFSPMVRSSDGEGVVEDLVLHNGGQMGAYSRVGIWIGEENQGTITLKNCNVEGFSNNGVYASRTPGVVQVEGGLYKNNDLSQVRIGSPGSYVDGASIEIDVSESSSPNPDEMLNGSGIRLEGGESGAQIRDCDISIGSDATAEAGIAIYGDYGSFSIENTRVEFDPDSTYGIRAKSPSVSDETSGTFDGVSITGDASGAVALLIEGRSGTTVENCCIQQTGSDRRGIQFDDCSSGTVSNTSVTTTSEPLVLNNSDVSGDVSSGESCPTPTLSSD